MGTVAELGQQAGLGTGAALEDVFVTMVGEGLRAGGDLDWIGKPPAAGS
jgi:hypothetical protein